MNHKNHKNTASPIHVAKHWTLLMSFALILASVIQSDALVSTYTFNQNTSGTYVPLSASRTIVFTATALATSDPGLGDDQNYTLVAGTIPFSFIFNGTAYTGVNINSNGFLTFGATLPLSTDRSGISNATAWDGSIVALGRDLSANTNAANLGEISYEVVGTGTNRTFVIQWSKFRRFSSSSTFSENYNFQIRLNEGGGVAAAQTIDIVYGACIATTTSTGAGPQVGLRGTSNADFNNRLSTTTWIASTSGATNTSFMRHNTTVNPASGLTFTYIPPSGCTVASGGTISPATASKCAGQTYVMSSIGFSVGTGTAYQWQVSNTSGGPYTPVTGGTGATTTSYTTPVLTAGIYYYVMTTTCSGCGTCSSNSNQLTLTINALPTVTVAPLTASICQPGASAVTLTAGGATTYAWSPTTGLTPTSGSPVAALPSSTTNYVVTGTDGNGCTNTATSVITVAPAVILSSVTANPGNVCLGGNSILTANAAFPAAVYCASTHSSGCSGDDVTNVSLASISNPTSGCGGTTHYTYFNGGGTQTTNLDVTLNPYTLSVSFGTDPNQYFGAWIDYNQDGVFSASEFLGASANAGANGTTGVTFSVPLAAYNGKTRLRIVGGNDSPVTASQACGASSSNFGETQDYDVTIVNATNPFSYLWSESPASGTLTSTTANPTNANGITVSETYNVTVSSGGCSATGSTGVTTGSALACINITTSPACASQNFTLIAHTTGGGAPFNYLWSDGVGGVYSNAASVVANLPAGTYNFSVRVTDGCGGNCLMNLSVTVNSLPGGIASGPASGYTNSAYTYTVAGYTAGSTFQWQTATVSGGPYTNEGGPQSNMQAITFTTIGPKFIRVIVTSAAGCQSISNEVSTLISLYGDNVCGAIPIVVGLNGTYSNVGATTEPGEAQAPNTACVSQTTWCTGTSGLISNSVWFSFVAPPSGRISLHFIPGNWDSQLALWSAPGCNDLLTGGGTLIAANDDSASSPFNAWIAPICVTPGQTYFVQVDGYGTTTNAAFSLLLVEESIGDGDACTVDACPVPGNTVTHTPVVIDDGNACTTDACNTFTGVISHTPVNTSDGNACTNDGCNSLTGEITHTDISIDDGNACTTDACNTSTGDITHTLVNTSDGNACTTDGCNSLTGEITHTDISIDDGNACTTDACNTLTGAITHTPVNTGDGNACTTDGCNSLTGEITHTDISIDDGNACTTDGCNTLTGAVTHTDISIDDGNACTTDACNTQTGTISHQGFLYDDGNPCTIDACNTLTGEITHTNVTIDDGNACTTDGCNTLTGQITHTDISVDDGNACTLDACNSVTGQITHTGGLIIEVDSIRNVACNGGNNGYFSFTASGGTGVYSYEVIRFSGGLNCCVSPNCGINPDFTCQSCECKSSSAGPYANVSAARYLITVSDGAGCVVHDSVRITQPPALQLTIDSVKNVTCFSGHDGYIKVSASGGTGTYSYSVSRISPVTCCVSNDCGVNPDFSCQTCECKTSTAGPYTNLSAALFVITVTDAAGCTARDSVRITQPSALQLKIDSVKNVTCFRGNNGRLRFSASGGSGHYISTVVAGGLGTTGGTDCCIDPSICGCFGGGCQSGTLFAGCHCVADGTGSGFFTCLSATTYAIIIRDSITGCSIIDSVKITEPTALVLTIDSVKNVTCLSGHDGNVYIHVSGGTPPYSSLVTNNSQSCIPACDAGWICAPPCVSPTFPPFPDGLGAGNYSIRITDANGCTVSTTFVIGSPTCGNVVNVRALIQGYYAGAGQMNPVLFNEEITGATIAQVDTVIIEAHNAVDFSLVDSYKAVIDTGGKVSGTMSVASIGTAYYIAIRHRSALFTCSANPVVFSAVTNYDFRLNPNSAYGSAFPVGDPYLQEYNLGDGYYAIYSGDLNQDEYIDTGDVTPVDNDNLSGLYSPGGYWISDINGDGYVDTGDVTPTDNNNLSGVYSQHP